MTNMSLKGNLCIKCPQSLTSDLNGSWSQVVLTIEILEKHIYECVKERKKDSSLLKAFPSKLECKWVSWLNSTLQDIAVLCNCANKAKRF